MRPHRGALYRRIGAGRFTYAAATKLTTTGNLDG